MASNVATAPLTTKDKALVNHHPQMLKVTTVDKPGATSLSPLVKDAAKQAHGKQEAAAAVLGKDGGNFSRDADAERLTLRDLRQLGPEFLAKLGAALADEYGPLAETPAQHAEKLLDAIQAQLNEVRQFIRSQAA